MTNRRGPRRCPIRPGPIAAAAVLLLAAGCAGPTPSIPSQPPTSLYQRTFGPAFPAGPPVEPPVRLEGAFLARDLNTVWVTFVGAGAYDARNACSEDYQAWAGLEAGALVVQVSSLEHADRATAQPGSSCTAEGYSYVFEIRLPAPFLGGEVRDRASGRLWIPPPRGIAELHAVPADWRLTMFTTTATPNELGRTYEPPDVDGGRDDRYLYLGQVFGGLPGHEVDAPVARITIHGSDVPVARNGDIGYLVNWQLGPDGMSLISYDANMTLDQFAAIANAVAVPAP